MTKPRHLVLLGGGHAHLAVLQDLARSPIAGWEVTLITPYRRQIYSGMLPGWVAGRYAIDECAIALDALAARAGIHLHLAACTGIDLGAETGACSDGSVIAFDRLSIDTGPVASAGGLMTGDSTPSGSAPGQKHAHNDAPSPLLAIRPIEGFVSAWPKLLDRILANCHRRFNLVVLGAGAAGVELALAIHRRALVDGISHLHVTLVGSADEPLSGNAKGARRRVAAVLKKRAIGWLGGRRARALHNGQLFFEGGADAHSPIPCDACLAVTGAVAPCWPAHSRLATDDAGFVRVGPTGQSVSHPAITAAGDIAAYADTRPKSGVYAVRAGPVLAHNLRALCTGTKPEEWKPQRRALYLLSTGDERAIAAWGSWAWSGRWVWRWKDRIDRSFVERFGADSEAAGIPVNGERVVD